MLARDLSPECLHAVLSKPRPVIKLQTFVYREQSSHGFTVEGFHADPAADLTGFWLACLERLDEGEMVEEPQELRDLVDLCRPVVVPPSRLARTIDAVCRGHLAPVRAAMDPPEAGARLTLAWNLDSVYVRTPLGHYAFFWHTSE